MAIRILYHQVKQGIDCPDGIAAAWVARKIYPNAEIFGVWYGMDDLDIQPKSGDRIVILDFSFSLDTIKRWESIGADILLIDHHKSAQELLGDISNLSREIKGEMIFDMAECGATLTWKYFFPNEAVPLFLEYVRDRDLWVKNLDLSDGVHEAVSKLGRTFDLFDALENFEEYDMELLGELGEVLLIPKRKAVESIARRAELRDLELQRPHIHNCWNIPTVKLANNGTEDRLVSDVCEYMYSVLYPDAAFVACISSDGKYSLRSDKRKPNGGADVSSISRLFGGGGHRNAAGFSAQSPILC